MAIDTIAGRLLGLDLFRGLDAGQIERIAREAERLIFRDGQRIIEKGKPIDGAVVIIGGRARALADSERDVDARAVEPGSLLGETAMLVEHHALVTVVAESDVRAVMIMREALRAHMHDDPAIAEHFAARLASRLQRMAVELRMIDERLAVACQTLARRSG